MFYYSLDLLFTKLWAILQPIYTTQQMMYSMKVKCFQSQYNHKIPFLDSCVHLQFAYNCFIKTGVCILQKGFIDLLIMEYIKHTQ